MTDKPIIFSGPMVRAILEGRKTQTRRVLKPQPNTFQIDRDGQQRECFVEPIKVKGRDVLNIVLHDGSGAGVIPDYRLPLKPGDRLWVRETWRPSISAVDPWHVAVLYPHDGKVKHWGWASDADFGDWIVPKAAAKGNVSPLFMPRWASRLTLVVTDVRVQRLQDISEKDAVAEGIEQLRSRRGFYDPTKSKGVVHLGEYFDWATDAFEVLWNSIHGPEAWDANPWVAAYTFTVHHCNIDQMEAA